MSERRARTHEPSAVSVRRVAFSALLLIAIVAASLATVRLSVHGLRSAQGNARAETPLRVPAPLLQAYPGRDLAAYREDKQRWLHGYGWIDRDAGVTHIPIERAMRILAARSAQAGAAAPGSAHGTKP